MIRYIGIDPGSKGAIAAIDDCGAICIKDLDKAYYTYWEIIQDWADTSDVFDETYVAVEDVCGRPNQSCTANTTFMKLAGMAELAGFCIGEMVKVKPQVWKRHFGLIFPKEMSKVERKHKSIELAKELFPDMADQLTASKDGRAEALLIAKYIMDINNENPDVQRDCAETV